MLVFLSVGTAGLATARPSVQRRTTVLMVLARLAASIVVGVMIIPTVSSLSEDALRAVPDSLREGAYGLGATKLEVSTKVVVPAALSGVIASFILAISRAIGVNSHGMLRSREASKRILMV